MDVSESTYQYGDLDEQQLEALIRAKLTIPQSKWRMISLLKKLDGASSYFRFLDLPPEMRNRVYNLLLGDRSSGPGRPDGPDRYPALLRTCKQVYSEARGVLYHDSSLRVYFDCYSGWREPKHRPQKPAAALWLAIPQKDKLRVPGDVGDGENDVAVVRDWDIDVAGAVNAECKSDETSPSDMTKLWPWSMADISNLDINMWIRGPKLDDTPSCANRFLYALAAVLNEGVGPQMLTVQLDLKDVLLGTEYVQEILYPLAKLRPGIKVKLIFTDTGNDMLEDDETERELEEHIENLRGSKDPVICYNALEACTFGLRELNSFLQANTEVQNIVVEHAVHAKQRLEDFYYRWDQLITRDDEGYIRKVMRYVMAITASQDGAEVEEDQWEAKWSEGFKEIDEDELFTV